MDVFIIRSGLILGAYLFGSIPTGLILSQIVGRIDIRKYGSHNIGATNVYRTLGKKLGFITLVGDVLKGFLSVYIVSMITGGEVWVSLAALAAFFGHLYPVYLKFSGGKGVATALGAFMFLCPKLLIFSALVFIVILWLFRYVSLSSVSAALSVPLFMHFAPRPYPNSYLIAALIIAIMITYRHKENIKRIVSGNESRIGSGG